MPTRVAIKIISGIILVLVLGFAAWAWLTLTYNYSVGERAGYVQKISHKGWLCKTWEGQLSMINYPGAAPELFEFSVRDEAVAKRVEASVGKRVALTYAQHIGVPSSCFGDTQYFITDVRVIE